MHLTRQEVVVVGITGPVGSGKSTLARLLAEQGHPPPPLVLSTDDYLPDYDLLDPLHRDLPEHADLDRLSRDLSILKSGSPTHVPTWSFHSHRREGEREVSPASLIICEGIHALHARARIHMDLLVYVDAPRDVRWARWEAIERQGERGFGVEKARVHFDTIAEPTFGRVSKGYMACAHAIVRNHGDTPSAASSARP